MTREERQKLVTNLRDAVISIFALAQRVEDELVSEAEIIEWIDADVAFLKRLGKL